MEFIHKKKAEKARTKQLQDQVSPSLQSSQYDDNIFHLLKYCERISSSTGLTYALEISRSADNLLKFSFSRPRPVV